MVKLYEVQKREYVFGLSFLGLNHLLSIYFLSGWIICSEFQFIDISSVSLFLMVLPYALRFGYKVAFAERRNEGREKQIIFYKPMWTGSHQIRKIFLPSHSSMG